MINLMELEAKDPASAIYENAGRHRQGDIHSKDAGDRFLAVLEDKHGSAPRFLWPAVEINIPKLNRELQKVIERWSEDLEKKVDRF